MTEKQHNIPDIYKYESVSICKIAIYFNNVEIAQRSGHFGKGLYKNKLCV